MKKNDETNFFGNDLQQVAVFLVHAARVPVVELQEQAGHVLVLGEFPRFDIGSVLRPVLRLGDFPVELVVLQPDQNVLWKWCLKKMKL